MALSPPALAILAALLYLASLACAPRAEAFVYWSGGGIGRADSDGSNLVPNFVGESSGCGVASDGNRLYWSRPQSAPPYFIGRASLPDGAGVDPTFISLSVGQPGDVVTDGAHIYWSNAVAIGRADLNGSNVDENFIPAAGGPGGVAVDGGHIYWTEGDGLSDGDPYTDHNRTIGRADLDGSNVDPDFIDPPTTFPAGVAVNGTHIFWTAIAGFPGMRIARANLNGTGIDESFVTGPNYPSGVAVDATHVYWANASGYYQSIGRADLDGSDVNQNFIPGSAETFFACDVAVDSLSVPPSSAIPPSGSPAAPVSGFNEKAAIKKCKRKHPKGTKKRKRCVKNAKERAGAET